MDNLLKNKREVCKPRGVCGSVLDPNRQGVGGGGGVRRGWGGGWNFLHFAGIFEFPVSF